MFPGDERRGIGLESTARRMWAGDRGAAPRILGGLTTPLAVLFGSGVRARNFLYDRGVLTAHAASIPVLSIGNLSLGGTGKTPVSAWIAKVLREEGWRPSLVIRGYGADETLLHRGWNPEIPVVVAPRRIDGVREAQAGGSDIVVLDDGFQHRAVRRDVDVVLCSPAHPLPPRLLPRGPFREPLRALRRADQVLVTAKGPEESRSAQALARELSRISGSPPVEVFPFRYGPWEDLDGRAARPPGGVPLAVTSVAEPAAFVRQVAREIGADVPELRFRDHHVYSEADAERIGGSAGPGWVATTEKDAVKLRPLRELLPEVRVLPLIPDPDPRLAERLLVLLGTRHREAKPR